MPSPTRLLLVILLGYGCPSSSQQQEEISRGMLKRTTEMIDGFLLRAKTVNTHFNRFREFEGPDTAALPLPPLPRCLAPAVRVVPPHVLVGAIDHHL